MLKSIAAGFFGFILLEAPISLLALTASAADYFPPSDAQGGWRTPKDKTEARALAGIDLDRLEQAYHATKRSNTENGCLVVISKGYLVLDKYFGKAHRNANPDMASTGKGFTSIACGVMLSPARRPGDRVGHDDSLVNIDPQMKTPTRT